MQITTITQQGNSSSVILPAPIMREMRWQRGQKVAIDVVPEANGVFIRQVTKKQSPKRTEKEFQNWLSNFIKEDAELLDELAHR